MTTKIKYLSSILIVVLFCGVLVIFQEYMADKKKGKYIQEIDNLQAFDVICDITVVVDFRPSKVLEQKVFQLNAEEKQELLNTLVEVMNYDVDEIVENVAINILYTYKISIRKKNSIMYLELPVGSGDGMGMSYHSDRLGYGVIKINAKGERKLESTISNIIRENQSGSDTDIEKMKD